MLLRHRHGWWTSVLLSRRTTNMCAEKVVVESKEVHRFMVECMVKVGTDRSHAAQLADVLIAGDERGHYSHGLNRLDMYVKDVRSKICKGDGTPTVLSERAGTAWVDGNNLLGPVVGNFCMDLAVKKAKEAGVGWVCCKGSNHFGIAGWYSLNACKNGMLGFSSTNTSPLTYPTRASQPALGTNPFALMAPGVAQNFELDMATTTVAVGKIEMQERKGESMPGGWGVDGEGHETHDPSKVLRGKGGLLPLGGKEITGGYKGYGLGMMVEVFCGILAGAHWGPNVRKWMNATTEADLGQCFVAIDPSAFAPGFAGRMQELMDTCRGLKPAAGEQNVLVAGDPEREHKALCEKLGGIPYHPNQIVAAKVLAAEVEVAPMKTKG